MPRWSQTVAVACSAILLAGGAVRAVAYPPRIKVFATNTGSRNLTVYDTRTIHLLAVAAGPSRVHVTNYSDNTVTVITRSPGLVTANGADTVTVVDAATNLVTGTVPVGPARAGQEAHRRAGESQRYTEARNQLSLLSGGT
ncbi:hypothetical protein [Amycolatopsis tucumanensis]|uniref:hypothetical protein n=1 Tax=Amycolatopsis tucumanensis TaxID=401106 RepID=UPI003D703C82